MKGLVEGLEALLNPALGPLRSISSSTPPPSASSIAGALGLILAVVKPTYVHNGILIGSTVEARCMNVASWPIND